MSMEIEEIKGKIEKATVAIATVGKNNRPHNIAIMYPKVKDGKLIVTDNFMKTSVENIKQNGFVSLIFWEGEEGYRIDGKAEYFSSGKWLDFVKALEENNEFPAKGAVVINVEEVKKLG